MTILRTTHYSSILVPLAALFLLLQTGCGPEETNTALDPICGGSFCPVERMCCEFDSGATACTDIYNSLEHCGGCGIACGPGEACLEGACRCGDVISQGATACGPTRSCCNGTCTAEDGRCLCGDSFCDSGDVCCDDACVDIAEDYDNCGACGEACPLPLLCAAGICQCPEGQIACGEECVDPLRDDFHCGG